MLIPLAEAVKEAALAATDKSFACLI